MNAYIELSDFDRSSERNIKTASGYGECVEVRK